jgi:hypothetical protein
MTLLLCAGIVMVLVLSGCSAAEDLFPPQAQSPASEEPDEPGSPGGDDASDPAEDAPSGDPTDEPTGDPTDAPVPAADVEVTGNPDGVDVAAPEGSGIYVDGVFTGETAPASIALDGSHTVGVGIDDGEFIEFDVDAGTGDATVGAATVVTNRPWRVAIVPVRTTIHGAGGPENTGIVTDNDVELFTEQIQATSDEMVEPFSYGTASWDIDVLPMVTDVPLHRASGTGEPPDGGRLIEEAGLTSVNEDYDFHIIFYGVLTEDGEQVDDEPCCLWGGGNSVALNNGWNVRERGPEPFEGFLHEWLHVVEQRHGADPPEPLSTGGLHGAQETVGEDGSPTSQWLNAYRLFMRSQISENGTHTGVFSTLRDGP